MTQRISDPALRRILDGTQETILRDATSGPVPLRVVDLALDLRDARKRLTAVRAELRTVRGRLFNVLADWKMSQGAERLSMSWSSALPIWTASTSQTWPPIRSTHEQLRHPGQLQPGAGCRHAHHRL